MSGSRGIRTPRKPRTGLILNTAPRRHSSHLHIDLFLVIFKHTYTQSYPDRPVVCILAAHILQDLIRNSSTAQDPIQPSRLAMSNQDWKSWLPGVRESLDHDNESTIDRYGKLTKTFSDIQTIIEYLQRVRKGEGNIDEFKQTKRVGEWGASVGTVSFHLPGWIHQESWTKDNQVEADEMVAELRTLEAHGLYP